MDICYKNNRIKKALTDALELQRSFGKMSKKVAQRMEQLKAAPSLFVMISYQAARCHQLKGDKKGDWAVDISTNHRLLFRIDQDPIPLKKDGSIDLAKVTDIMIIETTDYH